MYMYYIHTCVYKLKYDESHAAPIGRVIVYTFIHTYSQYTTFTQAQHKIRYNLCAGYVCRLHAFHSIPPKIPL